VKTIGIAMIGCGGIALQNQQQLDAAEAHELEMARFLSAIDRDDA